MVWLTLRRLRTEIILVALIAVVVALVMIISGIAIHAAYEQSGYAHCSQNAPSLSGACGTAFTTFFVEYGKLYDLTPWLNLLPLLVGIVLGVPLLARDVENGTSTLVHTQGISRGKWALTRIAVPLTFVVAFSLFLTALMTWWNAPFEQANSPYGMPSWDFEGVMPLTFGVLAFAVSASASGLLRRTVSAVAVSFVYVPLWLLADTWLRTVLPPPVIVRYAYQNAPSVSLRDWIIAEGVTDSSGHPIYGVEVGGPQQGLRGYVIYQPLSHYWQVQGIEAAVLLCIALLLLGLTFWYVRRNP